MSEEQKAELYARAWVNLTASSAEGWCLTVMEAATLRHAERGAAVGGLPESIEDGETGLLADDGPGLTAAVQRVVGTPSCASASAPPRGSARAGVHVGAHRARRSTLLEATAAARAPVRLRERAGAVGHARRPGWPSR